MFSVKHQRMKYKLMLIYALMFIIPTMFFLYIIITYVFPQFPIVAPIDSPQMITLILGLSAALVMSLGGLWLMARSIKSLEKVSQEAETFLGGLEGTKAKAEGTDDEVEKLAHYVTGMVTEIRSKMVEVNNAAQELAETNKRLAQEVSRDGLTKLYNQSYIKERLTNEFLRARGFKHPLSILMIDLDDFKGYNDSYGHLAGDQTLKIIAQVIMGQTRSVDLPARYGGEEFLIILPEANHQNAQQIAEGIRSEIAKRPLPTRDQQSSAHITASIGIGELKEEISSAEDLIAAADNMLYEAKKAGKNRVCG